VHAIHSHLHATAVRHRALRLLEVEHKNRQDENNPLTCQFRRKGRMELDRTSGLQILRRGV